MQAIGLPASAVTLATKLAHTILVPGVNMEVFEVTTLISAFGSVGVDFQDQPPHRGPELKFF